MFVLGQSAPVFASLPTTPQGWASGQQSRPLPSTREPPTRRGTSSRPPQGFGQSVHVGTDQPAQTVKPPSPVQIRAAPPTLTAPLSLIELRRLGDSVLHEDDDYSHCAVRYIRGNAVRL